MAPLLIAAWTVLGVALVISVVTDVLARRVLDVVTFPAIALALLLRFGAQGLGDLQTGLLSGAVGCGALAGVGGLLAWRGRIGAGDAKLLGAVGAGLGAPLSMGAVFLIALVGAVQAVAWTAWQGPSRERAERALLRLGARLGLRSAEDAPPPAGTLPYAVAIALGTALAMWWEATSDLVA